MSDLAIVLVSGGMDSLVTAAIANTLHHSMAFLHLNYGQKTQKKELECFHKISEHYAIEKKLAVDVSFLSTIGGSSLTDDKISVKKYKKEEDSDIPNSYVPFRNTHIISLAVSWAEVIGATNIYIGAVHEDSSGYPDCRPEYYEAMNNLIEKGCKKNDIIVKTPVINFSKQEIIEKAIELDAPLQYTWSCYAREDKACGICDSCALRLRGFQQANIPDPLAYHTRPNFV